MKLSGNEYTNGVYVRGIPESMNEIKKVAYRSRFITYAQQLMADAKISEIEILISNVALSSSDSRMKNSSRSREEDGELTLEERAQQYHSQKPLYNFDVLIVAHDVMDNLMLAISLITLESKVFDEWGLRRIEPFPRTALNFHGAPGTGKTLAAHCIASHLNRPILVASYAQIESKYHGEGPKNVDSLFYAAERDKAVLFIDEADSLLSRRLTNVTQGSEQAINSMRSQLLISLEKFSGIVIFSTNLVKNYDKAFETRVRSVNFPLPDEECRRKIWHIHLGDGSQLPLAAEVNPIELAKMQDLCGRDIKNAVIDAALQAARHEQNGITQADIIAAVARVRSSRINLDDSEVEPQIADAETSQKILHAVAQQGESPSERIEEVSI